jgi:hypothetical protein
MKAAAAMARIASDMDRHRHLFDLARDDLGRKLCKAGTDGVQGCIDRQESPEGVRWADLSATYEEWKSFQFPGNPIGVLHQHMADPHEVAGDIVVSPEHAVVTYGITDQARQEATWFQEGDGHQPARPFWGLTADALKEAEGLLDARFATA